MFLSAFRGTEPVAPERRIQDWPIEVAGCVGSSGMKRKGRRHLPNLGDTSDPMTWLAYSVIAQDPVLAQASTVQRAGFFARQPARNCTVRAWGWSLGILQLIVPLVHAEIGARSESRNDVTCC